MICDKHYIYFKNGKCLECEFFLMEDKVRQRNEMGL